MSTRSSRVVGYSAQDEAAQDGRGGAANLGDVLVHEPRGEEDHHDDVQGGRCISSLNSSC
ncbi:hypothetical protein [Streptomyces sp. NPDC001250]|uniref:hypothetical protein n=1 Tax=unclassified Streptomyces TaxID=2593676 RepID=UPI0033205FCF